MTGVAGPLEVRGLDNPRIVDLVRWDDEAHTVVLTLLEDRPWTGQLPQLEQLNDKLSAYFEYVLDGHLAQQYRQYAGLPVRLELRCVTPPDEETSVLLDNAAEVGRRHGLDLAVEVVAPESIERLSWERPSRFDYASEVLRELAELGLRPDHRSDPILVRRHLGRLYRLEREGLDARWAEKEAILGPQPEEEAQAARRSLAQRYRVLVQPLAEWGRAEAPAPDA